MTKSTFGFHKLIGATIKTVVSDGVGDVITLIDTDGVKYRVLVEGDGLVSLTKKSPRKPRAKKSGLSDDWPVPKGPSHPSVKEIAEFNKLNERLIEVKKSFPAWPYPTKEQYEVRSEERSSIAKELKKNKKLWKKHKAQQHSADTLSQSSLNLHYVSIHVIEKVLKPIVASRLHFEERKIVPHTLIFKDSITDELDRVEFLMAVEDAFGLELPDTWLTENYDNVKFERFVTELHVRLNSKLFVETRKYVPGLR